MITRPRVTMMAMTDQRLSHANHPVIQVLLLIGLTASGSLSCGKDPPTPALLDGGNNGGIGGGTGGAAGMSGDTRDAVAPTATGGGSGGSGGIAEGSGGGGGAGPAGSDAGAPTTCASLRNCINACVADATCKQGCMNRASMTAKTAHAPVQTCSKAGCDEDDVLCRCDRECFADGACNELVFACRDFEEDPFCDEICH